MSNPDTLKQTRILVQAAAAVCEEKKGQDTRILALDPADSGLSDFFLVTSATNDRQATAIADEIELRLKREYGVLANSVEGRRKGDWVLLDYVDFVVHVFLAERRSFYDIERLRKSARPFTPAEFDAELKTLLAEKTRAVRKSTSAKTQPRVAAPAKEKKRVKKTSVAKKPATKAAPKTKKAVAAKKTVAKKTAAPKKAVAKKVAAPKKAAVKKTTVAKKAVAKKTAAPKKAAAKKTTTRTKRTA
jgi:ribosome-associated protein